MHSIQPESITVSVYEKPEIKVYSVTQIRNAIGPAVGFSVDESIEDELLDG